MRILVYAPYWKLSEYYGGVLTSITLLFESIAQQGVSVSIYTTNAKYSGGISVPEGKPIILDGVNVYYFPLSLNGLSFFYSHALIKAVKKNIHNYDIVIIESLWSHAFPKISSICKKCNKPYIVALHGQLMPWALRQKWLKKSIYLPLIIKSSLNRASALHCTDPVEVQATKELNLHAPTFVLPNGVDLSEYDLQFEKGWLHKRYRIPSQTKILLFLGRLNHIKRPDIALDAFAATRSQGQDPWLVFAGPDEEGLKILLQSKAKSYGCLDKVVFTGLLSKTEVLKALADSDLLFMPSEVRENFGMSAVEAMAAGVPILVSEGVPVGEAAQKAGAGLVLPCDADAFGRAAIELLSDPARLHSMGARGKEHVREHYDSAVVASQMSAQLESIIATGRPIIETFN